MRNRNIWLFNAGNAFAGNPKWLFLYIQERHPEIECHWLCYRNDLVEQMRSLGYSAYLYKSGAAKRIGRKAGVYVVEQNKEVFQEYLNGIVVLNLWHGVGCKNIEHALVGGFMDKGIVRKHIKNEAIYRSQLFLVTSPMMERHFVEQCRLSDGQLIRAGYPSSFAGVKANTFDHDFKKSKGLSEKTKVAVYAPTFRDVGKEGFFARALPDMPRLIETLERADMLLVLKAHPQVENDFLFKALKLKYEDNPRLLFWDNKNDFYEVMDQVDIAIVDYSSIFYDLLAHGVKSFVRYVFDYGDDQLRDFAFDYMENTCGYVCSDFDQLLQAIEINEPVDQRELDRIFSAFWSYAENSSPEDIVQSALAYELSNVEELPKLYSFDVFDTLIGRTTTNPRGVFLYVQDKMREVGGFPRYLQDNYLMARSGAEGNCRQYVLRTMDEREDDRTEITFDMIFERLGDLYGLTEIQLAQLQEWELEAERLVTRPIRENIECVRKLVRDGNDVILISDMYLPEAFIKELLEIADPLLVKLPLFLSSTVGKQKTRLELFMAAYHSLDYHYGAWIHVGDNPKADVEKPRELGITACPVDPIPEPDDYSAKIADWTRTFDMDRVANLVARYLREGHPKQQQFAYAFASLYFVPYVYWAIEHALTRGVECLYFISRDGYHLKRIADAIIEARALSDRLQTHYIYGSRKAWRIPSQADEVDDAFFSYYGNFTGVRDYRALLQAASMDEQQFASMFPQLLYVRDIGKFDVDTRDVIVDAIRESTDYRVFLQEKAKKEREVVLRYLRQEIDFGQRFAFVEYWGRGYTQTCLRKLLEAADERVGDVEFYYARSILPTQPPDVRFNLTSNNTEMLFIEAQFANMPHRSVEGYVERDGRVEPIVQPLNCNRKVFDAYEECLPQFAHDFASIGIVDCESTMRQLLEFSLEYFDGNCTDKRFLESIAPLKDSPSIQADPVEFAPAWTLSAVVKRLKGEHLETQCGEMTVARSNLAVRYVHKGFTLVKERRYR